MWDEEWIWKGGLSGKTVWIKRLMAKIYRIMMMILITVMFIMYGTERPGPIEKIETSRITVSSSQLRLNWDCERFPCCKTSGLSSLM